MCCGLLDQFLVCGKLLCIDIGNVGKLVEAEDMKELSEHQKVHL
jgi:hypothetical protein